MSVKAQKRERLAAILAPVHEEIYNLLDMFEFFLMERMLSKPIEVLADSVRDLRIIIQQLLLERFLHLSSKDGAAFIKSLAVVLARRAARVPLEGAADKKYVKYCIGEILTCFEWAREIRREFPDDESVQRILALDIPVLRPFDYGLRSKIRLVAAPKTRKGR